MAVDKHLRALEGEVWASELEMPRSVLADGLLPDHYEVSEVDSDGLWSSVTVTGSPAGDE